MVRESERDPYVDRSEMWELVEFSKFTFHRKPRLKLDLPVKDLGRWHGDPGVAPRVLPVGPKRAEDLLNRFLVTPVLVTASPRT